MIAVTIGLVIVNIMQPGHRVPADMRDKLQATYAEDVGSREEQA